MSLEMIGRTDPGMVRDSNEDQVATRPELGLAILADGMGGHQAGEVASKMAIDIITRHFAESYQKYIDKENVNSINETKIMQESIYLANAAIFELSQSKPECQGMGATIVITLFNGHRMYVGHVGDSRLYRYRNGALSRMTEDHSVVQELLSRGLISPDEARNSAHKNLITRALGIDQAVDPDIDSQALQNKDIYLLCSDGLNDVLSDDQIKQILAGSTNNLEVATKLMIDKVNSLGGPDNVSVILVRTGEKIALDSNKAKAAIKAG